MYNELGVKCWTCSEADLVDLDAAKARDLIERCFYEAQRETFIRVKQCLGVRSDDETIHRSIDSAVRIAIEQVGGNYDNPTERHLRDAIDILADRAASWGTPPDIFEHHRRQIVGVLDKLAAEGTDGSLPEE